MNLLIVNSLFLTPTLLAMETSSESRNDLLATDRAAALRDGPNLDNDGINADAARFSVEKARANEKSIKTFILAIV
jgi:hypothetical protein